MLVLQLSFPWSGPGPRGAAWQAAAPGDCSAFGFGLGLQGLGSLGFRD